MGDGDEGGRRGWETRVLDEGAARGGWEMKVRDVARYEGERRRWVIRGWETRVTDKGERQGWKMRG